MSAIEFQLSSPSSSSSPPSLLDDNTLFVPSAQLTASPLEDPYMFDDESLDSIDHELFLYYNSQLTPEEQALLGVSYDNNNELYDQKFINWSSDLENDITTSFSSSYLCNDIIQSNDDSFVGQSSMYDDPDLMANLGGNLLLTQPLSQVTQNIIENQQLSLSYNWCDLPLFSDTQQQQLNNINNFSSKLTEQNQHISSENYYTDFQLLEA